MNTHQALLMDTTGTKAIVIAAGPRKFCKVHAIRWIDEHGLGDGEELTIVKIVARAI